MKQETKGNSDQTKRLAGIVNSHPGCIFLRTLYGWHPGAWQLYMREIDSMTIAEVAATVNKPCGYLLADSRDFPEADIHSLKAEIRDA